MNQHTLFVLFADVALVIVVARVCGRIARACRQPAVVGEIAGGILLGPTLLGALPGGWDTMIFPPEVRPQLGVLAQLGLVLFMFIVGLELDLGLAKGRARLAASISGMSIALPFALGCVLALVLYSSHSVVSDTEISRVALILFLGTSMSITAFPVLARILTDRGMQRTVPGVLSLASAAVDDVIAWSLLAFVIAVIDGGSPTQVFRIVASTALFAAFMFAVIRPLLRRLLGWRHRAGRLTPDILAVILVGLFASAAVTDQIGVHAIFGAFLFGAVMPRAGDESLTLEILERLEQISVLLLLPMFFVITGLGVDLGAIPLSAGWQLAAILAVAVVGKFFGAFAGARINKVPVRQSAAIGVLMNTRGLTELVILQVGRELGVLDDQLFAMLVVMALVTTIATEPLLRWIYPDRIVRSDIAAAERRALGNAVAPRVVMLLDDPRGGVDELFLRHGGLLSVPHQGEVVLVGLMNASAPTSTELGCGGVPDLAAMASAVEALHEVGRRLSGTPNVRVLCRFSTDPVADLAQIASVAGAEDVVVDALWLDDHPTAVEQVGESVLIAAAEGRTPPRDGRPRIACLVSGTRSGRTAIVYAARLALRETAELILVADRGAGRASRRLDAVVSVLRESGLDAIAVDTIEGLSGIDGVIAASGGERPPALRELACFTVDDRTLASETRLDERLSDLASRSKSFAMERI